MAQRPVHEIRMGRIKAAIWRNETDNGPRYNVTLARVYKTDDGWESTDSFGRDDLLLVAKVADCAHTWIHQQVGEDQENNGNGEKGTKGNGSKRGKAAAESTSF